MTEDEIIKKIEAQIDGDVEFDGETLEKYSRDASLFKVTPQMVVFPKHTEDVVNLVRFVAENKVKFPWLTLTARAAGTCMSGGSLSEGIIMDVTRYMNADSVDLKKMEAIVEPGLYFRDFEQETLPKHVSLPVYPASKSIAALGGMIMNNCGGERTLRYGQINNFVKKMQIILADGSEIELKKITRDELRTKMSQENFEGEIYRRMYDLLMANKDLIKNAKPKTSKNSSGYYLWNIWNEEDDTFDLTQLLTGSQGTLAMMTEATMRLEEVEDHTRLVVLFMKKWQKLPDIVNKILPVGVQSMETFDDVTIWLGIRFMPQIAKRVGQNLFRFALRFLPEVIMGIRMLGMPKLLVLVEVSEKTAEAADKKVKEVEAAVKSQHILSRTVRDQADADKYWAMRRESFALLRKSLGDKQTAPFVDDVCVRPEELPVVLPEIISILKSHDINVNIAGHAGSGNLHIIPLMDLRKESERSKIPIVSDKIYKVVLEHGGTITAEHNDGIIRTPYLKDQFGEGMVSLFEEVKDIFDPQGIFNPGKKVHGTKAYMISKIATE